MLKVFRTSTAAIRFYRCQRFSQSFLKLSRSQILPQRYLKCSLPLPKFHNVAYSASSSTVPSRFLSTVDDNNDIDDLEETYDELPDHSDSGCTQIKNFLYPHLDNDDELLNQINNCESEDILLRTLFNNNMEGMPRHHTILFVVKLWYCKNPKFKVKIMKVDNDIHMLLEKVLSHVNDMSFDELSVCFLFLTKLSINMQTEVMTTILERLLEHLKSGESTDCSLGALSRFAVAVNLNPQLNESFVGQIIMRHVLFYIDRVTTSHELRLLAICLNNLRTLLSRDTIDLVEKKVYQFIEEGKLKDDQWAILKILQFLCFPYWSQGSFALIRALLLELQDKIPTFNTRELEYTGMLCQVNFEPASVITTIAARALELLKNDPSPEMLPSTVFYSSLENRKHLTKLAKNYLISDPNPDAAALKSLFKALRLLKISDITVCNDYWSKVNNFIMSNPSQQKFHMITKYCHRYMHFNNNLNGTYKNYPLEKTLVKLLVKDLNEGISAVIPSRFSKAASFILAYGHTPDKYIFPEYIVQKIEAMQEQFTVIDCLALTRGIQVALQMRFNRERSPALIQQIVRMENVFNACTDRHLDQPNLSLSDLNSVIRSYSSRKSEMKASIYRKMIEKYETILHEPLNSRIIRDITFNLNVAKYSVPTLCNTINEYVIRNREFVLGDTVQKVLYCFYNLNYYPKDETIFDCATESINRDFDIMSGLAVVEGCLALSFYKELPGSLIDRVFNLSFIQRLEEEIEQCYSKDFYPQRVLNSVMQLNRAVCLDYPENGVPWFQQNYIEAQLSNLPTTRNKFHRDVKQVLIEYVTDEKLLKIDHITPYGYRIDFVLYIDANKTVMIPPKLNDPVLHVDKIAILLLDTDALCQNDFQNVRGKQVLKERHLEMMGFKVVQINYIQWNSMYMSLPGAKSDYVKGLLS